MRVLLVNSLYAPDERGGAEHAVRIIAEELLRRDVHVTVTCLSPVRRPARDAVGGVAVIRLPLANIYHPFTPGAPKRAWQRAIWHGIDDWNPVMARRLGWVMDEVRPDVVNLHNLAGFSAAAVGAAHRRGIPVVQTLHDYYFVCPQTAMFRHGAVCQTPCGGCRALTWRRRRASRRVELAAGVSAAMLEPLVAAGAFPHGRQRVVVPNPNPPADAEADAAAPGCRHVPGACLRLGFLGRLDVTKGLETLIAAMRQLHGLPVSAVIAGTGPPHYEGQLRAAAAGLPIRFLGHIAPAGLFRQIDLLVVPSAWREPFGRVVLEAFAAGVPVLGAASGAIPEVIGTTGAGLCFPPQDPAALAAQVRRLVLDGFDGAAWSKACYARSAAFDTAAVVDQQLRAFHAVLASKHDRTGGPA